MYISGGLTAVMYTDTLQAVLMVVGAVILMALGNILHSHYCKLNHHSTDLHGTCLTGPFSSTATFQSFYMF